LHKNVVHRSFLSYGGCDFRFKTDCAIKMTLKLAKEKLGKQARGVGDEELLKEIQIAELIAEIILLLYSQKGGNNELANA
jgi:hypothetical protein